MKVIEIKENEFFTIIKEDKVLIDCYANWCGPCRMLSPIIDELAEEVSDFKFYKLNIDEAENISSKYNIMSIPTILIFKDNQLQKTLVGLRPKQELKKELENI